jgi:CRISPR type III-A-associated protein Csm2
VPQALFDPAKPPAELVDGLAEEQADLFPNINKTQLRKFFGEVKDLYRQCQTGADYRAAIEPRFKMLRSKVAYASAKVGTAGSVPPSLKAFIDGAVKKVQTKDEFECFVKHFEAVVGFWFGKYADKRER